MDAARYHRQMLVPGVGQEGQARLAGAHAMVIGCGALGCPAADLLARAGVGTVSIVDRDVVELTNLQRQTLFDERDAREGLPKAEAAARRLAAVNSGVKVHAIVEDFSPESAEGLVRPHPRPGVLLDCTDNFETRYLVNDVAVKEGVPLVYGAAVGTSGMMMAIVPGVTACLRCVFPEPPSPGSVPTCDTAGVLGPVPAAVAAWQAGEAIKALLGRTETLSDALVSIDAWTNSHRRISLAGAKREDCPCCGERRFEFLAGRARAGTTVLCGRNSVQVSPGARGAAERGQGIDLAALAERLGRHGRFVSSGMSLRGRVGTGDGTGAADGGYELTIFRDGRAIVGGTSDPVVARGVYARYVGS